MALSEKNTAFSFDRPGTYRIQVEGFLDPSWAERLGGMLITNSHTKNQPPLTKLTGSMRDQAELSGVLNTLYELHLTLRSVEYLGN